MTRGRLTVRAVQLALLAIVAWGIFRVLSAELSRLSWADLTRWRPAALPLTASFLLLVGVYLAHALLWRHIVRDLQLGDLTLRETIRVYFTASLGRYVPGKVWQLAGMAVLAGRAGLPPLAATAAAVLGQIAFLATGMLFLALSLPGWRSQVAGGYGPAVTALVLALVVGGTLLWLLAATPVGHRLRERLLARAATGTADRLRSAFTLADRIRPRNAGIWAGAYFLSWVGLGVAFALFVAAFVPGAGGSARYLAGTIAGSYLLGYVVPLPAGIGAREGVMFVLLQPAVPEAGAALVISVLSRVWFTAAELLPLAVVPVGRTREDPT
ncbi:MAG TPA: lysylphosphatidylglycerol synthase domain-containing protein [Longimicrobiales bacterium]